MFRFTRRHALEVGIACAALLWAAPCLRAADAENEAPALSPEDMKKQQAELTAKADAIGKEISGLNAKLKARQEELDKNNDLQALRKQAADAQAAVESFVKTDARLVELRQARDKAQAAIEPARRAIVNGSEEAKAFSKERSDIEFKDALLDFKGREADFGVERHVVPRLYRDQDLSVARQKKETLSRQMEQARTDAENNSKELKELRAETDKARAALDAARPAPLAAQLATLYKSRADKEAALRALTADTLKTEDQAATEARNNAAKIRADITARDKEATALREKLAGLNRQRAEIDYQIQLAEFQLREGVGRRISFDPEVRNAEAAAANADNARRAKEASAPAIAVARGELDALRRQIQETEASANAAPEVVAARAALAAKEKAFNELRAKIQADAVAGLRAAVEGAAKEEEALRAKKLAEDEEAKGLGSAKAEAGKERAAAGARRQEIDAAMNKLYEQTAEADAVKAARDAALAAAKAYDEAYAASEVQKLMETARAASKALADKTAELRAADAVCTELGARIGEARQKAADISRQIKSLSK